MKFYVLNWYNPFEYLTINLFFDSLPWASSPWPTIMITNHEVMLIIVTVADLDKFFRTKKGKVIVFPNNIILNKKHNIFKFNKYN